jgi:hypothetical protein
MPAPPDFMRTPESANIRVILGALIMNPRYSSNIFLANEPDKNGQRIFFADTGMNADVRTKKSWRLAARLMNLPQQLQLKQWKEKLEGILEKNLNAPR